jgi:hypothetical protein
MNCRIINSVREILVLEVGSNHYVISGLVLQSQVFYQYFLAGTASGSSGQSSWLQVQRSGFDSRRHQIS